MRKILVASFSILILSQVQLMAQPATIGPELQVNTYTTSFQYDQAVAMDRSGRFVVVWTSYEQDGNYAGIFGRRYDSAGTPLDGSDFQVNAHTTDGQYQPRIGIEADGDFVVVWYGDGPGDYDGIFGRRFNSSGTPKDALEFRINSYATGEQNDPDITVAAKGRFMVAWEGAGANSYGIFGRRFDRFGHPQGGQFVVNVNTTAIVGDPSIAMDGESDFVIVWEDASLDGSSRAVAARRFSSAGTPRDAQEFQVNTFATGSQDDPDVAMGVGGAFVVIWESFDQDGDGDAVIARRYDANGSPRDAQDFVVNSLTSGTQRSASVAMDKSGGFTAAWYSGGVPSAGQDIFARRYDSSGAPLGQEFMVNTYTTYGQYRPSIAMNKRGQFVVAWESKYQDGDAKGSFAQKFDCEDTDSDGLCDPVDIIITSHMDSDSVDCATPEIASTRPRITWQRGNYDKFRAMISWESDFPKGMRITSGSELIRRSSWKPTRKQWFRACINATPDLYIRIIGVDNQRGKKHVHKRTRSNTVIVDTTPIP